MPEQGPGGSIATSLEFVQAFYDQATATLSYLVADRAAGRAVIIDPVLAAAAGLAIELAIDTHAHADHLTAASLLRGRVGAPVAIGHGIAKVQAAWADVLNLGPLFRADGLPGPEANGVSYLKIPLNRV